jgi:hypothetical protein
MAAARAVESTISVKRTVARMRSAFWAAWGGRPEGGPDLVGRAAEEDRVCGEQLVEVPSLVLRILAAEGPGVAAVPMLVEAGTLHDAVEGHERGEDQAHLGMVTTPGGTTLRESPTIGPS